MSRRGLCVGLITCPEESYRVCCVVASDIETSLMRRPWPTVGYLAKNKEKNLHLYSLLPRTINAQHTILTITINNKNEIQNIVNIYVALLLVWIISKVLCQTIIDRLGVILKVCTIYCTIKLHLIVQYIE